MSSRARPCFHALFKNPMMATIFAEQHKCQPLLPTREGRIQAERPTRTRSRGQGNGPEGERHTQLDRSPCPGRRCPCGCPQQVDRQTIPLLGESPGWHPGGSPPLWLAPLSPVHSPTILIRCTHETWIHLRGALRSSAAPAAGRVALSLIRAISGGQM